MGNRQAKVAPDSEAKRSASRSVRPSTRFDDSVPADKASEPNSARSHKSVFSVKNALVRSFTRKRVSDGNSIASKRSLFSRKSFVSRKSFFSRRSKMRGDASEQQSEVQSELAPSDSDQSGRVSDGTPEENSELEDELDAAPADDSALSSEEDEQIALLKERERKIQDLFGDGTDEGRAQTRVRESLFDNTRFGLHKQQRRASRILAAQAAQGAQPDAPSDARQLAAMLAAHVPQESRQSSDDDDTASFRSDAESTDIGARNRRHMPPTTSWVRDAFPVDELPEQLRELRGFEAIVNASGGAVRLREFGEGADVQKREPKPPYPVRQLPTRKKPNTTRTLVQSEMSDLIDVHDRIHTVRVMRRKQCETRVQYLTQQVKERAEQERRLKAKAEGTYDDAIEHNLHDGELSSRSRTPPGIDVRSGRTGDPFSSARDGRTGRTNDPFSGALSHGSPKKKPTGKRPRAQSGGSNRTERSIVRQRQRQPTKKGDSNHSHGSNKSKASIFTKFAYNQQKKVEPEERIKEFPEDLDQQLEKAKEALLEVLLHDPAAAIVEEQARVHAKYLRRAEWHVRCELLDIGTNVPDSAKALASQQVRSFDVKVPGSLELGPKPKSLDDCAAVVTAVKGATTVGPFCVSWGSLGGLLAMREHSQKMRDASVVGLARSSGALAAQR